MLLKALQSMVRDRNRLSSCSPLRSHPTIPSHAHSFWWDTLTFFPEPTLIDDSALLPAVKRPICAVTAAALDGRLLQRATIGAWSGVDHVGASGRHPHGRRPTTGDGAPAGPKKGPDRTRPACNDGAHNHEINFEDPVASFG